VKFLPFDSVPSATRNYGQSVSANEMLNMHCRHFCTPLEKRGCYLRRIEQSEFRLKEDDGENDSK